MNTQKLKGFLIKNEEFLLDVFEDWTIIEKELKNAPFEEHKELMHYTLFRRLYIIMYDGELENHGASNEVMNDFYNNWQEYKDVLRMTKELFNLIYNRYVQE